MPAQPLKTAIAAARDAGTILRHAYHGTHGLDVQYKRHHEPVTVADFASNDCIIRHLSKTFPNDIIISEESPRTTDTPIGRRATWIIDPLDGTTNFIAHIALFAITIARIEHGVTTLGLIYDPIHDELFAATRGDGATLNGREISVSSREVTRGAMLFAGRGYRDQDRTKHARIISKLERNTPYFRRLGSAAIMLASVASGRADAVILTGDKTWDTVAGTILIQEAGGKITDFCGKKWSVKSKDLVATNGHLHKQLVDITNSSCNE